MHYFYWIAGTILALAWLSRIVDAAIGMPSVADISTPEWDRDPITPAGNPRVSIIVPARNEREKGGAQHPAGDSSSRIAFELAGEDSCHVDGGEPGRWRLAVVYRW